MALVPPFVPDEAAHEFLPFIYSAKLRQSVKRRFLKAGSFYYVIVCKDVCRRIAGYDPSVGEDHGSLCVFQHEMHVVSDQNYCGA